ncbi:MAG: TIGR04086 family membrane protein [Oscillospiraceae bacterium]|nr:TIGR04086 family membrane protein [Oscillospiraceae bacterium]
MRKAKHDHRTLPYTAGLLKSVVMTLILSCAAALLLLISDSSESLSGTAAMIVMSVSCFFGGRTAGKLRHREGLRTGAICGIMYFILLLIPALFFRRAGGILLFVKAVLCIVFSAAGGVVGVNMDDTRSGR